MQQLPNWYPRLALIATILTFFVVTVGAFTRLVDAGLSCPDWPGCYGYLAVPQSEKALETAAQRFPDQPVETAKAWAEMGHRYLAGTLGLIIFALAVFALRYHRVMNPPPVGLAIALTALLVFQALLGMWTVTWLLLPTIVVAHLLGGMTILSLLWLLTLRTWNHGKGLWLNTPFSASCSLKALSIIAIIFVAIQIFLGGWTSANYAALICPDFPTCQNQWLPPFNFTEAFRFIMPIGINYDGGLLENAARVTIHVIHRIGALVVTAYLVFFAILLFKTGSHLLKILSLLMLFILLIQITLGILNVILLLPLNLAVAHNGGAALLLLVIVSISHYLYKK